MSCLDSPCGIENICKVAREMMPLGDKWEIYRYPGKAFVTKIENPNTNRYALVDCREKLTEDEIKARISHISR